MTAAKFARTALLLVACSTGGGGGAGGSGSGGDNGDGGGAGDGQGGAAGIDPGSAGEGGEASAGTGGNANPGGQGGGGTGGSGNDGNGGAASTGGQSGGAVGGIPCAQRPYCNDFEAVAEGARPAGSYTVDSGNTLAVASDKKVSGARSLAITASKGNARYSFTIPAGKLVNPKRVTYVRLMIWLDNLPGGASPGHWDIMKVAGKAERGTGGALYDAFVSFGGNGDQITASRLLYGGGGADCDKGGRPQQIKLKQWTCVELKVDETSEYAYGVNINGEEFGPATIPALNSGSSCASPGLNMGNWYVPDGTTFSIGWQYYHTQGVPVKFWIDDVIVDEKPIGCP